MIKVLPAQPKSNYTDLRLPDGTLVGRYDPARGVLEVRKKGATHYFDLAVKKPKKVLDNNVSLV
jgi:hypothetical protein